MLGLSYLAYAPLLLALYISTIYVWGKLQNRPPSPFLCLPVIGHLYLIRDPLTVITTNLANRYGPILFIWFGSRPGLVISSPSAAEECLTKNDVVFCNRPVDTISSKYRGYDNGSINFAPYGHHWTNMRKISAVEILSPHRLRLLSAPRADEVRLLVKRLCSPQTTEIRTHLFDTNMNIMTRMIFGKRYYGVEARSEEARRIRQTAVESFEILNHISIADDVPYLRWVGWLAADRKFAKYRDRRVALMSELIEDHRASWKEARKLKKTDVDNKLKPMIQVLLELQESDPEYYTEMVIQGIIVDLLEGTLETSTATLEWALSLLLNHPEDLRKVRAEIDNHVGYERLVNESDLDHLPYLRCVLNETLRMYPPLPFLLAHESSEECFIGGYRIPRGTLLIINMHGIQNDPKLWDNPTSFRPERFQGAADYKMGYKMMPFGAGRRSCPGESLASRVIELILGSLIQCLDFQTIDDKPADLTPHPGVNLRKNEPLNVKIQARQDMIKLLQQL